MLDQAVFLSVAEQLMRGTEVRIEGHTSKVNRTGSQRFRTLRFSTGGREYQAIEQNPEKPSRWGQLARQGKRVVQFRDLQTHKYVAVSVDQEFHEYERKI
jgi:hypothetical protein